MSEHDRCCATGSGLLIWYATLKLLIYCLGEECSYRCCSTRHHPLSCHITLYPVLRQWAAHKRN